jgi:hypothetical protein
MATTPTTETTTTPPSTPIIHIPLNFDYLNESWCELQYKSGCSSTGSIGHFNHSVNPEVLEKLLQEAQRESSMNLPLASPSQTTVKNVNSVPLSYQNHSVNKSANNTIESACNNSSSLNADVNKKADKHDHEQKSLHKHKQDQEQQSADEFLDTEELCLNYDDEFNSIKMNDNCDSCLEKRKQIELLIEKQFRNEKQIINLRNQYEEKLLLNKSFDLTLSTNLQTSPPSTPQYNMASTPNGNDWMKYWSSRPQIKPPKYEKSLFQFASLFDN